MWVANANLRRVIPGGKGTPPAAITGWGCLITLMRRHTLTAPTMDGRHHRAPLVECGARVHVASARPPESAGAAPPCPVYRRQSWADADMGTEAGMDTQSEITALLREMRSAEDSTASTASLMERLLPLVYDDLRRIAHRQLGGERDGHTVSTTALVHEAYLRLVDRHAGWEDRAQFFSVAAQAMRRVLVDYARQHRAAKRNGALHQVPLDDAFLVVEERADSLLALDEALTRLASFDARQGRVVECRFFGGLSEDETAEVLGVTARTVRRDWIKAKGWLHQELMGVP